MNYRVDPLTEAHDAFQQQSTKIEVQFLPQSGLDEGTKVSLTRDVEQDPSETPENFQTRVIWLESEIIVDVVQLVLDIVDFLHGRY